MKRKQEYSEANFDCDGNFDLQQTIEERELSGRRPTQYQAPEADQKWRARNVVTIHWNLVNIPCPYPSFVYIVACVIDHANPRTGRCDASQRLIAAETGYSSKWVGKVLDWFAANTSFLKIERLRTVLGRNCGRH